MYEFQKYALHESIVNLLHLDLMAPVVYGFNPWHDVCVENSGRASRLVSQSLFSGYFCNQKIHTWTSTD